MEITYAVVRHSGGIGYVVREVFDGYLPIPYTDAKRIKECKNQKIAQKYADKLNAEEGLIRSVTYAK